MTTTVVEVIWSTVTFGPSPYFIKEIDGLDFPTMRSGDSGKPRDNGEFIGYDFMPGRDITLKFDVLDPLDNMMLLSTSMIPTLNMESPLYFTVPGLGTPSEGSAPQLYANVRPRSMSWKVDVTYALGGLAQDLQALWHATDPNFYESVDGILLDGDSSYTIVNRGNVPCKPIVTFYGPAKNPFIKHADTGSGIQLKHELAEGEAVRVHFGKLYPLGKQLVSHTIRTPLLLRPGDNALHCGGATQAKIGRVSAWL